MPTNLELLELLENKVDSPERLAFFQAFGREYYADAPLLNLIKDCLIELYTIGGQGEGQNNKAKWLNYSLPGIGPITVNDVVGVINGANEPITILPTDTPVMFRFMRTEEGVTRYYIFNFKPGKGLWGDVEGTDAVPVDHSDFVQLPSLIVTPDDIVNDPGADTVDLGPLENGDYITVLNQEARNFTDSGNTLPGGGVKGYYFKYTQVIEGVTKLFWIKFIGAPGMYGQGYTTLNVSQFAGITNSGIQPGVSPLHDVLGAGNDSTRKIILKVIGALIQYGGDSINYRKGPYSTQLGFEDPIANAILRFPAKPSNDVVAMVSDINGMTITANQAASEIYLKNAAGDNLATLNVGFLNNEGTTFFYNESTQMLELKDDAGTVLSQVPVSAFVSNLIQSVSFNGSTPYVQEFKDAEGNVVSSVTFGISNIQGLQAALDAKQALMNGTGIPYFNGTSFSFSGTGSANNYLRGDGIQQNFAAAVRANVLLSGLSTSSQASITDTDNILQAFGKLQAQLNNALLIRLLIPASADLNTYTETGIYNQILNSNATSGTNYPEPYAGTLQVVRLSSTLISQYYHVIGGSGTNTLYTRIFANSWGEWVRVWTSKDFTSTSISNLNTLIATTLAITGKATAAPTAILGDGSIDIPVTEIKELTFFDTRNDNSPPSYYYGRKMVGELKLTAVVDNPPVNSTVSSYSHIITLVAYGDATGGRPTQLSIGTQGIAMRTATSDTTWGPWKRAYTTADFTMSASDVANWNTAYGWGNHAGLYAKALAIVSGGLNDLFVSQQTSFFFTDVNPANAPTLDSTRWFINQYRQSGSGSGYQIAFGANSTSSIMYHRTNLNGVFSAWVKAWSSSDFTAANIANWNTAFNWGNHNGLYLKLLGNILSNGTGDVLTINSLGNIKKRTAVEIRQDSGIADADMADWDEAHSHSQETGNPHNTQMSDIEGLQSYIDNAVAASRPYKVYTVLLKQIGTSAPEVSALMENTLGFVPTWSYVSPGVYRLNSTNGFPIAKTICFISMGTPAVGSASHDIRWRRESANEISVYTLQNGTLTNGDLNDASFELRIYN